jgi:hypothetical protein
VIEVAERSWVEAVGYRHEVLHTGVLATLLSFGKHERHPVRRAAASMLLEGAVGAQPPIPERRADGAHRRCDLLVEVLTDTGAVEVAVETKVDSDWTKSQLRGQTGHSGAAVMLALGVTALTVDDADLSQDGEQLHVVGTGRFAERISSVAGYLPAWTDAYLDALKRETHANEAARVSARHGTLCIGEDWRQEVHEHRKHWGFFSEVLDNLGDREKWERKTLISGPLMTRWCWWAKSAFSHLDEDAGGAFLEFMGLRDGRRRLAIKAWSRDHLPRLQCALWNSAEPFTTLQRGSRVAGSRKTCTVAHADLDSPADAAALAARVRDDFRPGPAFEKAFACS